MLPPGPPERTVASVLSWLYRPLPFLDALSRDYGDAFTLRVRGLPPIVVVSSPEAVKDVFSSDGDDMQAGKFNTSLGPFLGPKSLLLLDGPEHLRQRRLVMPPLHGERMASYGERMLDATDASIDGWPVGAPFSLHPKTQAITLEVILRVVFGLAEEHRIAERAALITEMLEKGAWPPLLVPWFRVDLGRLTPWGRFVQLVRRSDAAFYAELAGRREGGARGDDILSLLLEARHEDGSPMRDDEVRDQLVTLLVAGHETTATALAWAVRWLAASPPLWSRLAAEVATAAGADGRLDAARVAKLELLDATVKETLRLSPVVPMVGRYLVKPARVGGWELPARVAVMPSIYLVHRRPDLYPNPTRFDPDRFVGVKPSPYAWFPFGGGIRRCVGMAFALYEMKMVLASIVHRTRLALDGPPVRVVRRSITLAPSDGLRVRLLAKRARAAAPSRAAGLDAAHA